jgi:hypothetical protein
MIDIRSPIPLAFFILPFGLASCMAPPPVATRAPVAKSVPAPDWFHRELARARRAKADHRPSQDAAGALHAYYAILLPACDRVEKSGPDKYRPRCKILIAKAARPASPALPAASYAPCDDRDDSLQSAAEITACSD